MTGDTSLHGSVSSPAVAQAAGAGAAPVGAVDLSDLDALIACPTCDTLHRIRPVEPDYQARCVRCHAVLFKPRRNAMTRIVMFAIAAATLLVAAMFFPFLELEAKGIQEKSSVIDAILAYSQGLTVPLTFALAALIVILPIMRLLAILYALGPMAIGWRPIAGAVQAFRLSEVLRPWAMGEVFIVGVAVAIVKMAGLAHITLGPAFWAFAALVVLTVFNDTFMCRLTVWQTLETRRRSR